MATTTDTQSPLAQLAARLPQIVAQAGYSEMWGVELVVSSSDQQPQDKKGDDAPTQVVLHKFLRANNDDVAAADKQLVAALEWRKAINPASLVTEVFDARRFGGLGFVTTHHDDAARDVVVTWNIYGSVKDNKATFGNVQELVPFFPPAATRLTYPHSFIRWRAALMELGVQKLRLNDVKEPIPAGAEDPYRMIQVHDYQSVSFFRMDLDVKAASRETIRIFSMAYPELLAHKYFVNVPAIMGWVFGAMKFFLAPATLGKFHPMASGASLAAELKAIAPTLPHEYGGQGPSVKEGQTVRLTGEGAATEGAAQGASATVGETAPLAAVPGPDDQKSLAAEEQVAKTPAANAEAGGKPESEPKLAEKTEAGIEAAVPPAVAPAKETTQ